MEAMSVLWAQRQTLPSPLDTRTEPTVRPRECLISRLEHLRGPSANQLKGLSSGPLQGGCKAITDLYLFHSFLYVTDIKTY